MARLEHEVLHVTDSSQENFTLHYKKEHEKLAAYPN
jgi:hypothetical protein